MVNPFHESDTDILKEAFPLLEVSVIEDVLYIAKGDINEAFEMLLNMTNDTDKTKLPPQLPNRRNNNNSNVNITAYNANTDLDTRHIRILPSILF